MKREGDSLEAKHKREWVSQDFLQRSVIYINVIETEICKRRNLSAALSLKHVLFSNLWWNLLIIKWRKHRKRGEAMCWQKPSSVGEIQELVVRHKWRGTMLTTVSFEVSNCSNNHCPQDTLFIDVWQGGKYTKGLCTQPECPLASSYKTMGNDRIGL